MEFKVDMARQTEMETSNITSPIPLVIHAQGKIEVIWADESCIYDPSCTHSLHFINVQEVKHSMTMGSL